MFSRMVEIPIEVSQKKIGFQPENPRHQGSHGDLVDSWKSRNFPHFFFGWVLIAIYVRMLVIDSMFIKYIYKKYVSSIVCWNEKATKIL